MSGLSSPAWRFAVASLLFLLGSALFAVIYGQAPLFYSNQNQYLLHGLAQAGLGQLQEDWLANTADPTPIFSSLVAFTYRQLPWWTFQIYHALLLGAYAASLIGVFSYLATPAKAAKLWPVFLALFVTCHAGLVRWLSYRLVQFDYPWFLQAGVAGQYVLGAMFQPSLFGVFLLVALCLFLHDRPFLAAWFVAAAGILHSTYLLPGALLMLGFLTALLAERRFREAIGSGVLALLLVLPITLYLMAQFRPSSPEMFAQSQELLVHLRIPHHCRVDLWLDLVAKLQIAWVVLALLLSWRSRLFLVLLVPLLLSTLLTGIQVATGSTSLALLFPWRISVLLVPVATTVILTRIVVWLAWIFDTPFSRLLSYALILGLLASGVWIHLTRQAFLVNDEEVPLMNHVREHLSPGQVYLVPVNIPQLAATTRGSLSSDFKPLTQKKQDARIIPIDLQRFRLFTGAPIFVDFKSIPYKDSEVIEWHRRLRWVESIQKDLYAGRAQQTLSKLQQEGITHLVTPARVPLEIPGVELLYRDEHYQVHRLTGTP